MKKYIILPFALVTTCLVGCQNNKVSVTFTGDTDKVTFTGSNTATKGKNYSATIKSKTDKEYLKTSNFEVKIANDVLPLGKWSYNAYKLDIDGAAITGNVTITFKNIESDIKFDSKTLGLSAYLETPAKKGTQLIATLKSIDKNYRLPNSKQIEEVNENIIVTVGGKETNDYTFDDSTGKLTIPAEVVTGDVFITATGVDQVCVNFSNQYFYNSDLNDGTIYKGEESSNLNIYIDKLDCKGFKKEKGTFGYAVKQLSLGNYYPRALDRDDLDSETYTEGELKGKNKFYLNSTTVISYDDTFNEGKTVYPNFIDHVFKISVASNDIEINDTSLTFKAAFEKKLTLKQSVVETGKCLPQKQNISLKCSRYGKDTIIPADKYDYHYDTDINTAKILINEDNKDYVAGDIVVQLYPTSCYTVTFCDKTGAVIYSNKNIPAGTTVGQAFSLATAEEKAKVGEHFNHWQVFEKDGKALNYNDTVDSAKTAQGEYKYLAVNDTKTTFENDSWSNFISNVNEDYTQFRSKTISEQGKHFTNQYSELDPDMGISSCLGKTRKIVFGEGFSSVEYEARVIDVVRDKINNDPNDAKGLMTFEFTSAIDNSVLFGNEDSDWQHTTLKVTCEKMYEQISDSSIKTCIKLVDKYTIVGAFKWVQTDSMHLFPLSSFEAGLYNDPSHKEGADKDAYYYYKSGKKSPAKNCTVWLRTRNYESKNMVYTINENGGLSYQQFNATAGLAPAFCI